MFVGVFSLTILSEDGKKFTSGKLDVEIPFEPRAGCNVFIGVERKINSVNWGKFDDGWRFSASIVAQEGWINECFYDLDYLIEDAKSEGYKLISDIHDVP